jgi:hypothetical protein
MNGFGRLAQPWLQKATGKSGHNKNRLAAVSCATVHQHGG